MRLREFLAAEDKSLNEKYADRMLEQRRAFEELLSKEVRSAEDAIERLANGRAREKEESLRSSFENQWRKREEDFRKDLSEEFEVRVSEEVAKIKEVYVSDVDKLLEEAESLRAKLSSLEVSVGAGSAFAEKSSKVHRVVGAVMGLVGSIEKGDADVKTDIATLRKVCKDDDVIVAALDKAERGLATTKGAVLSTAALQKRFAEVKCVARKMALVGEGAGTDGLGGLLLGELYGAVMVPVAEKPNPTNPTSSDEERVARAAYFVSVGDLDTARLELAKVEGNKVKLVVRDWVKDAGAKRTIDECVEVLKLRCGALNSGMN